MYLQSMATHRPATTRSEAVSIFRALGVRVLSTVAEYCSDDDVWTWSAKVEIDAGPDVERGEADTFEATFLDHYPDGAEVHWCA